MAVLLRVWYLFIEHSGKSSHPCNLAWVSVRPKEYAKNGRVDLYPYWTRLSSAPVLCCYCADQHFVHFV